MEKIISKFFGNICYIVTASQTEHVRQIAVSAQELLNSKCLGIIHTVSFDAKTPYGFTILLNAFCTSPFCYTVGQYCFCDSVLKWNVGYQKICIHKYTFVICIFCYLKWTYSKQLRYLLKQKNQNYPPISIVSSTLSHVPPKQKSRNSILLGKY